MASYLDNGKSIILDCVLTDTARFRLASGDVSKLKIVKFALADDEINYGRYQKNHESGSAWRDLELLQTPVLEAFTNNASSMKHRLVTLTRNDLHYMPQLKLNEVRQNEQTQQFADSNNQTHTTGLARIFFLAADAATEDKLGAKNFGILFGANPSNSKSYIRIDQGINTATVNELSPLTKLRVRFPELYESAYSLQMPHHLVRLVDVSDNAQAHQFVDDDQIALYQLNQATATPNVIQSSGLHMQNSTLVKENGVVHDGSTSPDLSAFEVHKGPRGSILEFKLRVTDDLQGGTYFFERYGSTFSGLKSASAVDGTYYYIDHNIKVTGLNTGVSIDVPIRIIKYKQDT